jgi:hypothetical protein
MLGPDWFLLSSSLVHSSLPISSAVFRPYSLGTSMVQIQ